MNFNAENISLFDAFLNKELSETERLNFEERLESDPGFNAAFEEFKQLENEIRDTEVISFQNKLKEWDQAIEKNNSTSRLKLFSIAAGLAIIFGISAMYFFSKSSENQILADHFIPYENIITTRSDVENNISKGLTYYDSNNYTKAIKVFESFPNDPIALLYLGESQMSLMRYENAIITFKKLSSEETIFNDISMFHLALAYIGTKENDLAINTLKRIQSSSDYYEEAKRVLRDLQ